VRRVFKRLYRGGEILRWVWRDFKEGRLGWGGRILSRVFLMENIFVDERVLNFGMGWVEWIGWGFVREGFYIGSITKDVCLFQWKV
jgi:hypothetical protein